MGAGRSARGFPAFPSIVWESPDAEELRGRLWKASPGAVRREWAPAKRRGSGLADESLAKRRHESTCYLIEGGARGSRDSLMSCLPEGAD